MDKALNLLSLSRKGGKLEVGEEPTGAACRALRARLVIVASDAPDHARRRVEGFVAGTKQSWIAVPYSKDELGAAVGRTAVSMAALTDAPLALAFLQALEQPERYAAALEDLTRRTQRTEQRRQEEKAHKRNIRQGRTRSKR